MKGACIILVSESKIAYQNKDIVSKVFADKFKGKSLNVYGLDVPRVVDVLPTNLPEFSANELKIDNLFKLEDGSIAIIDYESEYKKENRNKYINYIASVLKRYENEGVIDVKLRMIVIYTGDVVRDKVISDYDVGAFGLHVECAFLSEINSEKVRARLEYKIENEIPLSDEELMEFIILPLTYKSLEQKKKAAEEAIELVKKIKDEKTAVFILTGIIVFANKIIDDKVANDAGRWISMNKLSQYFENEKQEAIRVAVMEKDAEIARMDADMAKKDEEIKELKAQLAALQKA